MTIKELKQKGAFLYAKSSQFIVGIFIVIGTIIAYGQLFSGYKFGFIIPVILAPLEFVCYKALLAGYNRNAISVNTKAYLKEAFTSYPKYAPVFIMKALIPTLVTYLFVALPTYVFTHSMGVTQTVTSAALTGNYATLLQDLSQLNIILIVLMVVSVVISIYFELHLSIAGYVAIENEDMSAMDVLATSIQLMKGHVIKYVIIYIHFIPYIILTTLLMGLVQMGCAQLVSLMLGIVPAIGRVLNISYGLIISFVNVFIAVMVYEVKLKMILTTFYKEVVCVKK